MITLAIYDSEGPVIYCDIIITLVGMLQARRPLSQGEGAVVGTLLQERMVQREMEAEG
jgi:hypothetical protein